MNWSRTMVVARKEFIDGVRDKRSIRMVLISAGFGPLLVAFMFNQLAGQNKAAEEIQIPVVGREFAPVLVNWLEQQPGVSVVAGPADPEGAVRDRKAEIVLVIDHEFAEKFKESRPAPVRVLSDSTRQSSEPKAARLKKLLSAFSAQTGSLRLIARGVNPIITSALKVDDVNLANSRQRAAVLLNVMLVFMMSALLTAGMQIATDSTAGERERGSLEPLLLNPVPRFELAAGKWLASCAAAFIGLVVILVVLSQVLSRLPLEELGVRFQLGMPQILLLIAATGPMALLAPAFQVYLSCFAKSYKEAQSYAALLVLAACVPGILSAFYPLNRPWMKPLPVLGQYALGTDILSGKVPSAAIFAAALLAAVAASGVLLWLTARLLSSEKIIFGRA